MDIDGALKEGYTLEEVNQEAARRVKFNYSAAKAEGYSDDEINAELRKRISKPAARSDDYKKYLEQSAVENEEARKVWGTTTQIPGSVFTPKEPLSESDWRTKDFDILSPSTFSLQAAGKGVGAGFETMLSLGTGIGAAFGMPAKVALSKALGDTRSAKEIAEEYLDERTYQPRGSWGKKVQEAIGPVMQAFPATGGYSGHLGRIRKGKASFDSKVDAALSEPSKAPSTDVPTQMELPLATTPEAIAEMQARGTGQPDLFFSEQGNIGAGRPLYQAPRGPEMPRTIRQEQPRPTMRVTPEGQAFEPTPDVAMWQDRAAAMTEEAQPPRPQLQHQDVLDFTPHGDRPAQFGFTDTGGRLDENGIPIRADLSMEAQNVQNPLQRNLWGDELPGRTGDGGLPLTRALDKMPPGPERDAAMAQLGAPGLSPAGDLGRALGDAETAARSGVGVGGPRGAQRGAIDVRAVKDALEQLKRGLIRGPEALKAFVGTYDPQMDHSDISKGIGGGHIGWFPAIKNSRELKSEGRLVWMSPQDFHAAALPRYMDSKAKTGIGERKRSQIRTGINDPGGLSSVPVLRLNEMGKIVGHEGRHRMDVMKELGVSKAPVYLHTTGHSNANGPIKHLSMVSEDGSKKVPVPESIFPMGSDPLGFTKPTGVGVGGPHGAQRGAMDFRPGLRSRQDFIEGLLKTKLRAPVPTNDEIIAASRDAPDGKGITNLAAGATLEALKRRSPLIQGVSRVVQHAKAVADSAIRDSVFPFEDAARRLSKEEITQLATVLQKEMFARRQLTAQQLADVGLSERQLVTYTKLRDMQQKALDVQNAARALKGQPPVTALEAYLSSRWQGDFRRGFRNSDGKLVWVLAADNKHTLNADTRALFKAFPDLKAGKYSDQVVRSGKGGKPEASQIYTLMLDVLGRDDPSVAKIKSWAEGQLEEGAAGAFGQEKHFETKANVRGFVGDRPGRDPKKESIAMLQQQINYAKNAHKWSGMQAAGNQLKGLFSNEDLNTSQPNNIGYAKQYFADQIGGNEFEWVRGIENSIRNIGISPNQIGRGLGNVKALWVAQKLAGSLGFVASQAIQMANMAPTMMFLKDKYGGSPLFALPMGIITGTMMATGHVFDPKAPALYKSLSLTPGLGEFLPKAMKYAEDNSVIAKSVYDESPIGSSFGPGGLLNKISSKTIAVPETFLRGMVYMTYATQLKSGGKIKSDLEIFRLADEHTRASMGDYAEGERAMLFNKMGNLGNAVNVLQTFPVNYYNQWSWAAREAKSGNNGPLLAMLMVNYGVAGAMGIPGFQDADRGFEAIKDMIKESSPLLWRKLRDISLKELVVMAGGEQALAGALSTETGVAMTSRASAPAGTDMLSTPAAPYKDLAKIGGSAMGALADPLSPEGWAQLGMNLAPTGIQGALETGPLKDFTSVPGPGPGGKRVYGKPTDMAAHKGMYARTPEEERLRSFGLRSQKEAFTRDQEYLRDKRISDSQKVAQKLPDNFWAAIRANKMEKAGDLMRLHVELTGKPITDEMIQKQITEEYTTPSQRLAARKVLPVEALVAYKRYQQIMKEAGYQ